MSKLSSLIFAVLAAAAGTSAYAADPYVGLNIGQSNRYTFDCAAGAPCDRSGELSGKLFGGFMSELGINGGVKLSQGVELMAYKIGKADVGIEKSGVRVGGAVKTTGLAASYVAQAEFSDLTVAGRLGVGYGRGQVDYTAGGSGSKTSFFAPVIGVGLRYPVSKQWSLNADWDRLPVVVADNTKKGAVNMFSLGAGYKF